MGTGWATVMAAFFRLSSWSAGGWATAIWITSPLVWFCQAQVAPFQSATCFSREPAAGAYPGSGVKFGLYAYTWSGVTIWSQVSVTGVGGRVGVGVGVATGDEVDPPAFAEADGDALGFAVGVQPTRATAAAIARATRAVRAVSCCMLCGVFRVVLCVSNRTLSRAALWELHRAVESVLMTPADLSAALLAIVTTVVDQRREAGEGVPDLTITAEDIPLERPKNREHGDWSSNVAMRLAKKVGANPRELAAEIAQGASGIDGVASAEVAGPGFINFRLEAAAAGRLARTIVEAGEAYGRGSLYDGLLVNLEFVSANPTGPIHLGGARWAAVGDSLARILQAEGADVTREYYFNDHGSQIDRFARSLQAAYLGEPTPEDGYGGAYIGEIAAEVARLAAADPEIGDLAALTSEQQQEAFRGLGTTLMFQEIKDRLHAFGVDFDVYFHEDSLHASGAVERAIQRLDELGHIFEADGAIWLRTTTFGDDRDRVIVRSNGEPAYISGDLGYYLDKRERGFEQNIIMLGADHHGYIGRLMAMVEAFGDVPNVNLQILIGQMVNLVKDGEPVKMSKRAGTIVTLDDLVDVVGVDAARYALVRSSTDSQLDVDLDLLTKRSNDNPVFYVQYAHARTCSVAANAVKSGVDRSVFKPELLTHETESALLGGLQEFPRVVAQAAELREPHRVARYIEELAGLYHAWYAVRDGSTRVLPHGDEPVTDAHRTRLWLNDATGQVVRNGLALVGVSAPERM